MADPLCAGCGLPAHTDPCHTDTGALLARIADLERQLAAAITHPLAVAAVETNAAFCRAPKNAALLNAALDADHAWSDAGRPLHAEPVSTPYTLAPGADRT